MTDTTETTEKPARAPRAAAAKGPHVHQAISSILASLSVEKGGKLPSNMGGKAYIQAADVAAEVKRQFVDQELILLPTEKIEHYEVLNDNGKKTILIAITGTYTVVSTRDSSSVVISGTGDGLANGTAVASNIASTNAFKNALLRFFLITEQSVEDAAKGGDVDTSAGGRSVQAARQTQPAPRAAQKGLKDTIREDYIENAESPYTKDDVNALLTKAKAEGAVGDAAWQLVLDKLKAGETV